MDDGCVRRQTSPAWPAVASEEVLLPAPEDPATPDCSPTGGTGSAVGRGRDAVYCVG